MAKYTIVAMPGDGIGKTVLPESIRVLEKVGFPSLTQKSQPMSP